MERIIKTVTKDRFVESMDFAYKVFCDSEGEEGALVVRNLIAEIRSKG